MPTGTVHFDAMQGVRDVILSLGLTYPVVSVDTPLPPERVYLRDLLSDRSLDLPSVVVAKPSKGEKTVIEDNETNVVGYPVHVGIVSAENQDLTLEEWPLRWRQLIADSFDRKQPSNLKSALDPTVKLKSAEWEAGPVIEPELFRGANLLASTGWVWVWVWKPR